MKRTSLFAALTTVPLSAYVIWTLERFAWPVRCIVFLLLCMTAIPSHKQEVKTNRIKLSM